MKPLDPLKEERIIQAVFTIAGKKGLAGINITEISKVAGVGVGTLYTYFKSKDDLIQEAYYRIECRLSEKAYENLDRDLPVKESLKRVYHNILQYRLQHYAENVFLDQYQQSDYIQLHFAKQMADFHTQHKCFLELLRQGQQEGIIVRHSHLLIFSFVHGAIRELALAIHQKVLPMNKRTWEANFHMVWKGISQ